MTGNFRQVDPARGANLRVHQWRLSDPKMYVSANQMYGAKADVGRQIAASLRGVGNNIRQDRLLEQAQARQDQLRQESQNRQDTIRAEQNQRQDAREEKRHQLKQGRIQNVGGRLVHVDKDGMPKVIYSPPSSNIDQRLKEAKLKKLQEGDPLKQAKVNILKQLMPQGSGQAPAAQQEPQVQLQSGEVTTTDPNLIQAQTAQQAPAAPAQPQAPSALDNLTPEQKQAMALNLIQPGMGTPLLNNQKSQQFQKPANNKIETKIIDAEEGYARLQSIKEQYKSEYQTFVGQGKGAWYDLKARFQTLPPEEARYLTDFSKFRQSTAQNLNLYIKEITGAQMSEAEAKRLSQGVPVAGNSIGDGDSPPKFEAKMTQTLENLALARMRYHFMRSGGWSGTQMSPEDIGRVMKGRNVPITLPKMRSIFNNRVKVLQRAMKMQSPRATPKALRMRAIGQAKQEFGI